MDYETNRIITQEELDKMGEELSNYAESLINQQFKKISNDMNYEKKYKEIFDMKKDDLLYLIENLMENGKLSITDIAICHTKALERKIAVKDEIIHQADNCIFESVFTDSLGKPADGNAMQRKLEWLEKLGTHNMEGIFKYLRNESKIQRS